MINKDFKNILRKDHQSTLSFIKNYILKKLKGNNNKISCHNMISNP